MLCYLLRKISTMVCPPVREDNSHILFEGGQPWYNNICHHKFAMVVWTIVCIGNGIYIRWEETCDFDTPIQGILERKFLIK